MKPRVYHRELNLRRCSLCRESHRAKGFCKKHYDEFYTSQHVEENRIRLREWAHKDRRRRGIPTRVKGIHKQSYISPERKVEYQKKHLAKYAIPLERTNTSYKRALQHWTEAIRKLNPHCIICGKLAEISHHLIFKSIEPLLSLNINNGIALCDFHHAEIHWPLSTIYETWRSQRA